MPRTCHGLRPIRERRRVLGLFSWDRRRRLLTRLSMKEAHQATAADVVAQPQIVSSPEPALGAMSHPKGFPGLQAIGAQRPILAREH